MKLSDMGTGGEDGVTKGAGCEDRRADGEGGVTWGIR